VKSLVLLLRVVRLRVGLPICVLLLLLLLLLLLSYRRLRGCCDDYLTASLLLSQENDIVRLSQPKIYLNNPFGWVGVVATVDGVGHGYAIEQVKDSFVNAVLPRFRLHGLAQFRRGKINARQASSVAN